MPAGSKLPPAVLQQIADMLEAGATSKAASDATGVDVTIIHSIRRRIETYGRADLLRHRLPKDVREAVLDMWVKGFSLKRIAHFTKQPVGTVGNIIFNARMDGDKRAVLHSERRRA